MNQPIHHSLRGGWELYLCSSRTSTNNEPRRTTILMDHAHLQSLLLTLAKHCMLQFPNKCNHTRICTLLFTFFQHLHRKGWYVSVEFLHHLSCCTSHAEVWHLHAKKKKSMFWDPFGQSKMKHWTFPLPLSVKTLSAMGIFLHQIEYVRSRDGHEPENW